MPRGVLRIYLGAAPGVGKTFAMLNEGWRRHERGTDVVVGYVETHGRANTAAQLRDLEVVPRRTVSYRGRDFEEMDVAALLARAPAVALVDELAHTNVPGAGHAKRWQDIEDLLAAGIDVISTVNIQHLESLNDVIQTITGTRQQETVPDAWVRAADQVELVDMDPEALRRRMAHGNIYGPDKVDVALANYFRAGNLTALRELALLWVADKVDDALQTYMEAHGIEGPWEARERIVVGVTGSPGGDHLIRRASRMALRAKGELVGVHVTSSDGLVGDDSSLLNSHRRLVVELGGTCHEVAGTDVAGALIRFAHAEHATQLVLGATRRSRWAELLRGSVATRVLRDLRGIDVHVIDTAGEPDARLPPRPRLATIPAGRQLIGLAIAVLGLPALTAGLIPLRDNLSLGSVLLIYLLVVVLTTAVGGAGPAVVSAVGGFLLVNWFFTPPIHTFTVSEGQNVLALVVYLAVAGTVAGLVDTAARRRTDAARARSEAEALANVAGAMAAEVDPLAPVVERLLTTFALDGAAVIRRVDDAWHVEAAAGASPPTSPEEATTSIDLTDDARLVLTGRELPADDRIVLSAFCAQLAVALDSRRLHAEAAEAAALAEGNQLRTALLAAVSHDLRTPLSSIKASVTSLLQPDVHFGPTETHELLATIDEETDRLNSLVGNLLDMSRLQTGSFNLTLRAVGLEEVVPTALVSLGTGPAGVEPVVDVPESLPRVVADPALLERVVANIVGNAMVHAIGEGSVRIEAGAVGPYVDLRVVDRGPGIPNRLKAQAFQPFQRLGDSPRGNGVGLGLAVARGFTEAMGGELTLEDTPGGGLTVVVRLPVADEPAAAEPAGPGIPDAPVTPVAP